MMEFANFSPTSQFGRPPIYVLKKILARSVENNTVLKFVK